MKVYDKLVRDKIPEIIKEAGKIPTTEVISGKLKEEYLEKKLEEEVNEYLEDKNLEELADVMEVLFGLANHMGYSEEDLLASKSTKDYKNWDKSKYIKKAKEMPLKALMNTGSEFFKMDEEEFVLTDKLKDFINNESFKANVLDTINMRVIEFYKNRNYKFQGGK